MNTIINGADPDVIRANTAPAVLEHIDSEIEERIRFYSSQTPAVISRRIAQLEKEWDIERWLEVNAASLALAGVLGGLLGKKKCLLFSGMVLGFLLLHGTQGWCPPVPALRRLGIRTRNEIDREKYALKVARGDFSTVAATTDSMQGDSAKQILEAVTKT